MSQSEEDIFQLLREEPTLIFTYIKKEQYDVVGEALTQNVVNINTIDSVGNDVITRLLKAKQYDLILPLMKKKNWNVNNQNEDGNTFGHILACDNSLGAIKVVEQLTNKTNYLPNLKNNNGDTALDLALNNRYLCTAFKILEDKRFNDITVSSFKNLVNTSIKSGLYGKYSKITNLEIIVENMDKKELSPIMRELVDLIHSNIDDIKKDILNNHFGLLESIVNRILVKE